IELARELVRRTPRGLTKVFYSDSGATAVEVALKIAYQYHRQKKPRPERRELFVSLTGAYHGDTVGSVSVGGIDLFHAAYRSLLFKTIPVPAPVAYRVPDGLTAQQYLQHCFDEVERVLAEHHEQIAAFVIEPLVQGAAGILVHPPGYLRHVRELTRRHGVLLIADEVAVGFGRTGTMFACEQEDVCPDLLCLAKGISAGYLPLAATLTTDEVFEAFLGDPAEGKTFYHGHTYTGNALGCAAALASLRLLDEKDVLANVRANTEQLARRLREIAPWPHVGDVRQKGIMVGIELVEEKARKTPYPATLRMGHQVTRAARRRGVIIRPLGDVVVLMPAPAMPPELVDRLCDAVFESIAEVTSSAPGAK
ncbi:MAG TPA: adenosylmethionine--8-amino-7-oxononanoate transaminase, partial [Planctomycetaceae bacterium]|nr:adenosylmethionine--8-amino-7-oxononanoate transaminase [Planctomycetaceae bacterium]